jgi:hypothetical protein
MTIFHSCATVSFNNWFGSAASHRPQSKICFTLALLLGMGKIHSATKYFEQILLSHTHTQITYRRVTARNCNH